jgi:hypothetical protein
MSRAITAASVALDEPAAPASQRDPAQTARSRPSGRGVGATLYPLLPWILLALIVVLLIALGAGVIFPDTWFGLAGGREILQHGFSTTNTWTRYGSREWVDQQWGAHLAFYGVWEAAGAAGLVALNIVVISAGLAFCLWAAARRGGGAAWTTLVLALLFASTNGVLFFARAESFSVLCFGLLCWILTRDEGRLDRGVFLAIPLIAVWANLHAAVLVGAGVCGVYAISCLAEPGPRVRPVLLRALALASGAALACLATPVALGLPWYLRRTMDNPDFRLMLPEWHATTLGGSPLFTIMAFAAIAISSRARMARRDRVVVWILTIAGFTAIRSELWAWLDWLVVLPAALESLRPVAGGRVLRVTAVVLSLLAAVGLLLAIGHDVRGGSRQLARSWPRAAARVVSAQLRRDPRLKVYADQPLADWLLFEAPAVRGRLAIDGRFEVFDHATFEDVDALSAHPIRIAPRIAAEDLYVLSPTKKDDGRLVRLLERRPGIVALYRSTTVVILRRF